MGKKYRNLYEKIISKENIRDAYYKTIRNGNRYSKGHLIFKENLEVNLYIIQKQLEKELYERGEYYNFPVFEPKKRIINSLPFRDRVVQHAINNIIEPIFESTFYSCSYACRKKKGTHKGIYKVQSTMRKMQKIGEYFFLKMDFSKYFQSVYSKLLKSTIAKKITDNKTLNLIYKFICENGIKIGNLISQLCANVFGHIFDNFIKTKLRIKHYFRYMDDTVIFHKSKEYLQKIQRKLQMFMKIFLKLKFSAWFIQKAEIRFLDFLGMRIKSTFKLLRKNSVTRAKRNIKRFIRLKLFDKLRMYLASWLGHAEKADSFNLLILLRGELEYARNK